MRIALPARALLPTLAVLPLLALLPVLALLTAASATIAQTAPKLPAIAPGAPDPTRIAAGTYAIEPDYTQVMFALDHFGFSLFRGMLSGASGTLVLDPRNPAAAQLAVRVPISSIYVTSRALNQELFGTQFFDIQHFPDASFVSTRILPAATPNDWTTVDGRLTLHGITRPATMKVHFHGAGRSMVGKGVAIGFDGRIAISRSEFGMGAGVPLISDQVQITIGAAFEQQL